MRLDNRIRDFRAIQARSMQALTAVGLSLGLAWHPSALAAPTATSYLGLGEDCCGEDPHPVHGIHTSDGGYVLVGKSADASGAIDGFILKVKARPGEVNAWVGPDSFQSGEWAQSQGTRGNVDGMNNVAQLPDGSIVAVGFQASSDGQVHRYIAKYDLQNGTKAWEARLPSPQSNRDSAFESLVVTRDGGVVTTGVINAARGAFEGFKSYGNPVDGQAFVAHYSAAQLGGTSAPSAPAWETIVPNGMSGKAVRQLPGDNPGFIAGVAGMEGEAPFLVKLSASGSIEWQQAYESHGELTDVAVLSENGQLQGFAIVGHRDGPAGGIDGSITKVSPNGTTLWHTFVGNPVGGTGPFAALGAGNPQLIFDECWGVQGTIDGGAVVGCGTGIEGCDEFSSGSAIGSECRNDPRTMWRGLVVKVDKNGQEVWSRVDSFVEGSEYLESASEYVSLSATGEIMSVVDQGFGIGVLTLEATSSNRPIESGTSHEGGSDPSDTVDPSDESDLTDLSDPSDPGDLTDESDATDPTEPTDPEDDSDPSDGTEEEEDTEEEEEGDNYEDTEEDDEEEGDDALDEGESDDEDDTSVSDDADNDVSTEETDPTDAVTPISDEGSGGCAGTQGASAFSLLLGLFFLRRMRAPRVQV